jgi:hypothetical protein
MKLFLSLAVATALLNMSAAQAATKPTKPLTVEGLWEQSDDQGVVGAWFLFEERDGFFNGRLVKAFPKPDEPVIELCTKCTGDQKNARMMGLTIINGMKRNGLSYKDGSILDPRDGNVYHAEMTLSPDGKTLAVRGYLFVPLLGKTQIWKRLPDDAMKPEDIPPEVLAPPAN